MTADSSYSLEALESRWQLEKTPQSGLRLAEEYRRRGDLDGSIEALSAGLEVYPAHTSSRVALSRYLVDAGRYSEAVPHLEQIVASDPAHLVVNKLLVEAYAGVGRLDDAADKLAIYEMMGEGDADIERLRALLGAGQQTTTAAGVEPTDPISGVDHDVELAPVDEPSPEVPEPVAETAEEAVPEPVASADAAGENLPSETRATALDEAEEQPREAPAEPKVPGDDPFQLPTSEASEASEVSAEPFDEPFGSAFEEVSSSSSYWQGVADEGIFVLETPEGLDAGTAGSETMIPVEPEPGAGAVPGSTVTLGKLYLEQGHREEAAEVFEEVLAREPSNEAARRELEATARSEPRAAKVVREPAEPTQGDQVASRTDRGRAALTTYRARLRKAIAAGV